MLVSVVMPSYNHAKYVVQAARSVLDQTHRLLELVVIDDGSSDGSVELLQAIDDPRMKLVVQENQGAHAAINRGLEMARGDYLAVINSDDVFAPTRVAECLKALDREQTDFACSWIRVVDEAGTEQGIKQGWKNMRPSWSSEATEHAFWLGEDFALNLLAGNFVSTTSNMLFRRRLYEQVGGMRNLRFAHDWDFMLRLAPDFGCSMVPQPLLKYRQHGANTISSNRKWMLFEVVWTLAANLHRYEGGRLFGPGGDPKVLGDQVKALVSSVHVEGLDKLFWVLRSFLDARRAAIGAAAETELLDNPELRQVFVDLIAEA